MKTAVETIESRSYKTYKARLRSAQRLQRLSHAWNAALISTSVATTVASVSLLIDPAVYGERSDVLLVGVSILGLTASFVVAARNYGARAREMTGSYRKIQRLSVEAELLKQKSALSFDDVATLSGRYQDLLDESENHTEADHIGSQTVDRKFVSLAHHSVGVLYTVLPWVFLLVPILIVTRFIYWCFA